MECKWNANKKFRSMPLFAAIALTISRYLSSSIAVWAENKQIKWNSEEFSVVLRKNVQFWSSFWLPFASINFHIYLHLFTKWMKKKISREKGANWRIWLHLKSSVFYFFERKIWFQNKLQQIFPRKGKEIEQNVNTSSQIQFEHVFFFITLNINWMCLSAPLNNIYEPPSHFSAFFLFWSMSSIKKHAEKCQIWERGRELFEHICQ